MTIVEIRKLEENREGCLNVVHFQKEGSFYHANDWSAWLMTMYPIGKAEKEPMQVTAKKMKDGYIHAFVGFPATSLEKYIPNDGSIKFTPVSNEVIDVALNIDFGDTTIEEIRQKVEEWKLSLPIQGTKKQRRENQEVSGRNITRISDILARIVSLPMEEISPKEAYDILRDLRNQVSTIF